MRKKAKQAGLDRFGHSGIVIRTGNRPCQATFDLTCEILSMIHQSLLCAEQQPLED